MGDRRHPSGFSTRLNSTDSFEMPSIVQLVLDPVISQLDDRSSQTPDVTLNYGSFGNAAASLATGGTNVSGIPRRETSTFHDRDRIASPSTARPRTAEHASADSAIFWKTMDGSDATDQLTARIAAGEEDANVPLETEIHILNHRRLLLLRCALSQLIDSSRRLGSDPSSESEEGRKRVSGALRRCPDRTYPGQRLIRIPVHSPFTGNFDVETMASSLSRVRVLRLGKIVGLGNTPIIWFRCCRKHLVKGSSRGHATFPRISPRTTLRA
jgi:hypothetical protein